MDINMKFTNGSFILKFLFQNCYYNNNFINREVFFFLGLCSTFQVSKKKGFYKDNFPTNCLQHNRKEYNLVYISRL